MRCHAIQRNKYLIVYPANNYLFKCYGIHNIFFPSCGKMNNFVGFPTLENTNKFSICKSWIFKIQSTHLKRLTLCFVDITEKASRTWNCNRLNSNGISVGITGRRGLRTSPFDLPFRIAASMTLSIFFLKQQD